MTISRYLKLFIFLYNVVFPFTFFEYGGFSAINVLIAAFTALIEFIIGCPFLFWSGDRPDGGFARGLTAGLFVVGWICVGWTINYFGS
jgi:hypothetical protein